MNRLLSMAALLGVVAMVGLSCERAVAPPDSVAISEHGKGVARSLTYQLTGIRAAVDIQQGAHPFPFSFDVVDSIDLGVEFWDPSGFVGEVQQGLARTAAGSEGPFGVLRKVVALSAGSALRSMPMPYTLSDSLIDSLRLADSTGIRIAFLLDSLPAAPWDSTTDSVYGRWITDSTVALDSLCRVRSGSSTSLILTDREVWLFVNPGTLRLVRKDQRHLTGGEEVFTHHAQIDGEVITESLRTRDTAGIHHVSWKRNDASQGWWRALDSCLLLTYSDSLVSGSDARVTKLVDSTYSFLRAAQPQAVGLRFTNYYATGDIQHRVVDVVEVVGHGVDSLVAYTMRDVYRDESTRAYRLGGLTDTVKACSLLVWYKTSDAQRSMSRFGTVDSVSLRYLVQPHADWSKSTYASLTRTDYYFGEVAVDRADWEIVPAGTVLPALGSGGRPAGTTRVTVNSTSTQATKAQRWTLSDTGATDRLEYLWVNRTRDTVVSLITMDKARTVWSYATTGLPRHVRRGRVERMGDSLQVSDTLVDRSNNAVVRVMQARLDSSGCGFAVMDNAMQFFVGADRITAVCTDPLACAGPDTVVWLVTGDSSFTGDFFDPALNCRFVSTFTATGEGYITGRFDVYAGDTIAAGSLISKCEGANVSPLYDGTATLYGIFDNVRDGQVDNPFVVHATASVQLWGTSSVGSEDDPYQWQ